MRKHGLALSGLMIIGIVLALGAMSTKNRTKSYLIQKESVLDRKIHIEKELVAEIPGVVRWCDRIALLKRRANIGGCELYVEEEGQGGLPLVLINGGPGGTHHYFHPWFSRAKGFARVIYYDQRGCGLSDWNPGSGYSVDQAAGDLENLRLALGISRWVVLGYSYGGFLAQYYTVLFPERVAGLILVSAMPGMRIEMKPSRELDYLSKAEIARLLAVKEEVDAILRENKIAKDRALKILLFNNTLNGYWKRQDFYRPTRERAAQMALYEWENDGNFNEVMSESVARVDLTGEFENCPVPTLVTEGKWDLTWNTDKPGVLLGNHPGARLVMFEHSGHNVFEDEPERFFKLMDSFMEHLTVPSADQLIRYKNTLASKRKSHGN